MQKKETHDRAMALFEEKDYKKALSLFAQCLNNKDQLDDAYVLHMMALCESYSYRFSQSMALFDRALRLDPANSGLWFNKGLTIMFFCDSGSIAEENYEHSLEAFDKATYHDPSNALNWYYRGLLLARLDNVARAKVSMIRSLELDPNIENLEKSPMFEALKRRTRLSSSDASVP